MRKTLKQILIEYGVVGVVLYLAIFFLVLGGAWLAMKSGFRPASVGSQTGTFLAAYIVTKLTQPLRIAATVILTPLIARLYERITGRSRSAPPPEMPSN